VSNIPLKKTHFIIVDTNLLIIYQEMAWIFDLKSRRLNPQPNNLSDMIRDVPNLKNLSAVYQRANENIVVFIGTLFYVLHPHTYEMVRRGNMTDFHIPFVNLDVIGVVSTYTGKTFLVF